MNISLFLGIIVAIFSLLGMVFSAFVYLRNPQEQLDKRQAVAEKEADGKSIILSQQIEWERNAVAERFKDMQGAVSTSMSLAQNHIHTIDTKVDKTIEAVNMLSIQVGKLQTIIEERFPKKI